MAQANDSITVTPGTGATVATHLANGKEHQVVMVANPLGTLDGTANSYLMTIQDQTTNASEVYFDLWNGSASNTIKIHGVWVNTGVDNTNSSTTAARLDWFRTSTVGTGGTAHQYNGTSLTINITPKNTSNDALPAGVSARLLPSGGATSDSWLFATYHSVEETWVSSYMQQYENVFLDPRRGMQEYVLNPSQGLKVVQGSVDVSSTLGFLVAFTVE